MRKPRAALVVAAQPEGLQPAAHPMELALRVEWELRAEAPALPGRPVGLGDRQAAENRATALALTPTSPKAVGPLAELRAPPGVQRVALATAAAKF